MHPENPNEEQSQKLNDLAKSGAKKGAKAGGKVAKEAGKKLLKKAGKQVAKIGLQLLSKLLLWLSPYILLILLILFVGVAGYYVIFEFRGSEQLFEYDAGNEREVDAEKGYKKATVDSGSTVAIKNFYDYMSQNSYWQILTDDNTKLELYKDTHIKDYYDKEDQFLLNSNLLFALDERMFKTEFRYPEQFVKPPHYDPKKLELLFLTDDEKRDVIVESKEYDEDGKETGEKVKSVADYGISSIFKYKEDEINMTIEGTIYQQEVYNDGCDCVTMVPTDIPFVEQMEGYPQKIHLITKAITMVGEFEYEYEKQKLRKAELTDGVGSANDTKIRVQYATHSVYKTETSTDYVVNPQTGKTELVETSRQVHVKDVPLFQYRNGAVYETKPVESNVIVTDKEDRYLQEYLFNFEAFIPDSVMDKFDFEERTDGAGAMIDIDFKTGTLVGSESHFQKLTEFFPTIEKYAIQYGVDPYLIFAKMMQESGGNNNIEDGAMQITGNGSRTVSAKNVLTGQIESHVVYNESDRRDVDKSVRWAVMYFATKLDKYKGDSLKALQSYNFDIAIIEKMHPESWNSNEWMRHREEARIYHARKEGYQKSYSASYSCAPELTKTEGTRYGDVCYIENVLRYYSGSTITPPSGTPQDDGVLDTIKDSIKNGISSFMSILVKDYSLEKIYYPFKFHTSGQDKDYILQMASSLERIQLFSESADGEIFLWEKGFSKSVGSGGSGGAGMTYDDVIGLIPDASGYTPPLNKKNPVVTSGYGWRIHPITGVKKWHEGVDLDLETGDPVYSIGKGTITTAVFDQTNSKSGYGNYIIVNHGNGSESRYAHLHDVYVRKGDTVESGSLIATGGNSGGSTGSHLHFEIRVNGETIDPESVAVRPSAFNTKP